MALTALAQLMMIERKENATDNAGQKETEIICPDEFFSNQEELSDSSRGVGNTPTAIRVKV